MLLKVRIPFLLFIYFNCFFLSYFYSFVLGNHVLTLPSIEKKQDILDQCMMPINPDKSCMFDRNLRIKDQY